MKSITRKELINTNLLTNSAKNWAYQNLEYLNNIAKFNFFGTSTKMLKGSEKWELFVMYLQPAGKVSRATLCSAAALSGCEKPCLINSGLLGKTTAQKAATKRTILMLMRPEFFRASILREIDAKERRAIRENVPVAFRLNGTSDIDFSEIIASRYNSQFWDYTKQLSRVRKNRLANYSLTFSASMYSDQSIAAFEKAVKRKYQIAVAFNTANTKSDSYKVPEKVSGIDLETFDNSDARFLDSATAIGTLSRKGSNASERASDEIEKSFFVNAANFNRFSDIIASA